MVSGFESQTEVGPPDIARQSPISPRFKPSTIVSGASCGITNAAVVLLAGHIIVLAAFGRASSIGVWSDIFEISAALLCTFSCIRAGMRSRGMARPFWYLTGSAVATWSLARCIVLYDQDYRGLHSINIVALLLFFLAAAPMFVTVFLSDENFRDRIGWEWILDASQILGLILIVYLFLIYIPLLHYGDRAVNVLEDQLLLWRNVLLSGALVTRALFSSLRSTRRLYLPVGLIMGLYAASTWFANRAQSLSDSATAWYELAWAVPFILIAIAAAFWQDSLSSAASPSPRRGVSRVVWAYVPSLVLPILLILKYRQVLREQILLALCGLIVSIILFNVRLILTQRRQHLTAEALQASEHQYRSLFERNMAGVYRCTPEGRLLECNPAFARIFGYTRDEFLGLPLQELYFGGPTERARWIAKLVSDGGRQSHEFYLRRKDGSPVWVLLSAHLETESNGRAVIEGTLIDITEGKLTSIAIEDWKRRYDAAVLASEQIIYESDPGSKRVTLGGCVPEILGYTAEELSGDSREWLALIHPDDLENYFAQLSSATTSSGTIEFEYRARRRDNEYRTLREHGRGVRDSNGRVVRIVGFISDVTEHRALESQLRQAQKMEAVGRLAGGVAHDFNNLLTVISGYSAMQLERTRLTDPTHHEAEQIKAAADRGASLTQQLLAFSRQQVMQPLAVNLNDLIRSLDKMLRRLIGEDIEVISVLAAGLGAVKVDPGQVDQVLMNLVVNARDAMPSGGKIAIETQNIKLDESYTQKHEYVRPGDYVMLSVTDNGVGIPAKTQARIFEPFFTTKEPGKGTGLGLSMVYGIVKQSGGSIEVYSELNQGTTVKIYLPRIDEVVTERIAPVQAIPQSHGSEHVLLVEDDALLRRLTAEILGAHGYLVHALKNIADLQVLLEGTPTCSLLLTDVVMPVMKGPELASHVARHWPGIKVLYMSGYTSDAIVHHGILNEGLFFLQKPFTPAALIAKVHEVLTAPVSKVSAASAR